MLTLKITTGVVEADVPADGGKWAIYCEHFNADGVIGTSVLQDTNKRRLAAWKNHSDQWCCYCQEEGAQS
jgi:hypothetical protein